VIIPFFYPQLESQGHTEEVLVALEENCHNSSSDGRVLEAGR
jgi:hypothetical protein